MNTNPVENLPDIRSTADDQPTLTQAHKAAIVLASLSAETATAIAGEISDGHLRIFAQAFSELETVPPHLLQTVAAEFVSELAPSNTDLAGGIEEARRVLGQLTDEERVERILADLDGGDAGPVWPRIESIEEEKLVEYIQAQRLPIAAAIFSKLSVEKSARLLNHAEAEFSQQILLALSRKSPPPKEIMEDIAGAIDDELLKPSASQPSRGNAGEAVGEIINNLPSAKRDAFLAHMLEADPEVGAEVRKAILTFEELHHRLPASGVPELLREVGQETLLIAIKHGQTNAPDTVEFLFSNISKRMVEQYREELEEMDDLTESDGEEAQRIFTSALKRLVTAGEIKLNALAEKEGEDGA